MDLKELAFFCIIDLDKDKKMPVLITNNHLIDDNYIKENKWINITLNDNSEGRVIIIDENRDFIAMKSMIQLLLKYFQK